MTDASAFDPSDGSISNEDAAEYVFGVLDNAAMDVIANQVMALAATIRNTSIEALGDSLGVEQDAAKIWVAIFEQVNRFRSMGDMMDDIAPGDLVVVKGDQDG